MQLMSAICSFAKDAVQEDATEWLLSASWPFPQRSVREGARPDLLSDLLLS